MAMMVSVAGPPGDEGIRTVTVSVPTNKPKQSVPPLDTDAWTLPPVRISALSTDNLNWAVHIYTSAKNILGLEEYVHWNNKKFAKQDCGLV